MLLSFALLGASAAAIFLILPSSSPVWFLAAPLAVFANVGFGASVVAMNAYLPTLAKESPEVQKIITTIENTRSSSLNDPEETHLDTSSEDVESPLIQRVTTEEVDALWVQHDAELSRITSKISSLGIALGYSAGIFLLIVALIPVTLLHGSTFALRLAIGLSGIWWAIFSIPAALWLPDSENSQINGASMWTDDATIASSGEWSFSREIVGAWRRLGNMLRWKEVKKLRNTFKYLAAWFLLSDGGDLPADLDNKKPNSFHCYRLYDDHLDSHSVW